MSLVYALVAKGNPSEIRYVGKTDSETPNRRLSAHLSQSRKLANQTYKHNMIRKALADGDEILAIILESGLTSEEVIQREIFLIAYYREQGHRITNATDGGEGSSGRTTSEETKVKQSISMLGQKNALGAKRSREFKENLSILGSNRSDETLSKMSMGMRGNTNALGSKHSDATKEKIRAARTGNTRTDETKANMRTAWIKRKELKKT